MKNSTALKILAFAITLTFSIKGFSQAIIADHTFVDKYSDIPKRYIDSVKKRWLSYAGESHSEAIRYGMNMLQTQDSKYAANITEDGTPEGSTNEHLRVSRATWGDVDFTSGWIYTYGEEDWWTSETARQRTRDGIKYCNENGFQLDYFAFGWCWDGTADNDLDGTYDPVYHTRWGGITAGGPDGDLRWGLDADDHQHTGNSVSMDTYIDATRSYIEYCSTNHYPTIVFFTTGPVDNGISTAEGEEGYQQYLKWEYLRDYVKTTNYVLFDYADILSYNDNNELSTTEWTDNESNVHTFPIIHNDNLTGDYVAHITSIGALRLAKAMWVLLAMEEGWDSGLINKVDTKTVSKDLEVYPNPAKDQITVELPENLQDASLETTSITGCIVISQKIMDNSTTLSIPVSNLPDGNYMVKITSKQHSYVTQLNILK
jgi:hypothetical protein